MSSDSETTTDIEKTDWTDLTTDQKRLLKTIGFIVGPKAFERPELKDKVEKSEDLEEVIDSKERVVTTLRYTALLNKMVDAGYLTKTFQGGENPIVLDLNYEEERDTHEVAPFGEESKLHTMVSDVLDRNGLSRSAMEDVDPSDFNEVINVVNNALEKTVLVIVSDPSKYRLKKTAISTIEKRLSEVKES